MALELIRVQVSGFGVQGWKSLKGSRSHGSQFTVKKTDMISRILNRIAKTPYACKAVEEKADLSAFKEKPTARILLGVFLIGFSYVIGWPAVSALAALALYLQEPLVAIIGGPLTYGLSHLIFLAGMYLAGAKYSAIFMRWATRMLVEKTTGKQT